MADTAESERLRRKELVDDSLTGTAGDVIHRREQLEDATIAETENNGSRRREMLIDAAESRFLASETEKDERNESADGWNMADEEGVVEKDKDMLPVVVGEGGIGSTTALVKPKKRRSCSFAAVCPQLPYVLKPPV